MRRHLNELPQTQFQWVLPKRPYFGSSLAHRQPIIGLFDLSLIKFAKKKMPQSMLANKKEADDQPLVHGRHNEFNV
ncbi:hypothetical protein RJD40_08830 [Vibrio scophthalmi]|uniref:hypothetical protein n=1 Tax=Vibrio scophthalmi TaxID=45658 RepID=UPI003AAE0A2D